jgi:hypothetical protein
VGERIKGRGYTGLGLEARLRNLLFKKNILENSIEM